MEIYFVAIIILATLAISALIVGVSNDAANFLTSAMGSKVAPRHVILIIASLGILAGVTFSSGMMEVARKSIFHPKYFIMPELMIIFLAVMLTVVLLLDLYNTFGLPTSTTVAIIFALLGAAVAISAIKISQTNQSSLGKYINSGKALFIISGILLSVIIAFVVGAIIQYITRFIFTFDFKRRLKRYGAIWGGAALTAIFYFIIIKGLKGASFITDDMLSWIKSHTITILVITFLFCSFLLQIIMWLSRINILKIIILIGTFALAMSFAANDLVNFVGVPLAGINAYEIANISQNPLNMSMEPMQHPIQSNTLLLLIAGIIMAITLWISKKARTVTNTEIDLGRQDEGIERFGSSPLARIVVRMVSSTAKIFQKITPISWEKKILSRFVQKDDKSSDQLIDKDVSSFDLLRGSVNLVVASALISFATSLQLPLSTTYVTFMVAMGTSLSDRAWGSESAVYRVTGVLTVIGGWFFTAFMALTVSSIIAVAIYYWRIPGVIGLIALIIFLIQRNHKIHKKRRHETQATEVFNLKKINDAIFAINSSFKHSSYYLQEVNKTLNASFEGLFSQNRLILKATKKETKKIQKWANIIIANIFKTLRLLHREDIIETQKYAQTISALQEIAESHRDALLRAYTHIDNNHKGLLPVQIEELRQIKACLNNLLDKTANALLTKEMVDYDFVESQHNQLKKLAKEFDKNQILRIQDDSSKTRLSILFYGLIGDSVKIAEQTLDLLKIFQESFILENNLKNSSN